MNLLRTEGLILRSIPYQDYDQILTLYTETYGLVSGLVKAARSKRKGQSAQISPLTKLDLILKPGRQELYSIRELSTLHHHLFLRKRKDDLNAACTLAQILLMSQPLEKPSPPLYRMLIKTIERIPDCGSLAALIAAFRLKVLRHDGLLDLSDRCGTCDALLSEPRLSGGELFCPLHAPHQSLPISCRELEQMKTLTASKRFQDIESIPISAGFSETVKKTFEINYL